MTLPTITAFPEHISTAAALISLTAAIKWETCGFTISENRSTILFTSSMTSTNVILMESIMNSNPFTLTSAASAKTARAQRAWILIFCSSRNAIPTPRHACRTLKINFLCSRIDFLFCICKGSRVLRSA